MNDALERAVLTAGPDDAPDLADMVMDAAPAADDPQGPLFTTDDLISPDEFYIGLFVPAHGYGAMAIAMKAGKEVDIGQLAETTQGRATSDAMYRMLSRSSVTARLFLTKSGGFMKDVALIGSYGYMVGMAIRNAPLIGQDQ